MAKTFDICIRGGGIVGRTLALHLAAKQLRVALALPPVEADARLDEAQSDIRAYALNPASRHLLESVRCWPNAQDATPVIAMQVMGDDGGQVRFTAAEQGCEALNWIVDVPTLEDQLTQAVRFQLVGSGSGLIDQEQIQYKGLSATAQDIATIARVCAQQQQWVSAEQALPVYLRDNAWKKIPEQGKA